MKTLINFNIVSDVDKVSISYIDNLGATKSIIVDSADVFQSSIKDAVESYLQDDVKVPLSNDTVKDIKVENGIFAISGNKLPLKLKAVNTLSVEDKVVYDAFSAFVESYTGSPISTLASTLGAGAVTINGVVYNSESTPSYNELYLASNDTMRNATLMGIKIFNN